MDGYKDSTMIKRVLNRFLLVLILLLSGLCPVAGARQIIDMVGRRVAVPDMIQKVYGTSPPATNIIYAVDPGLVAALNVPLQSGPIKFLDTRVLDLPVAGGWFGQGNTPNMETILSIRPDIILVWMQSKFSKNREIEKYLAPFNIPILFIVMEQLSDYPDVFRFMGNLLGKRERTESLARYAEQTILEMSVLRNMIPEDGRVSVYYAENKDGLSTECIDSIHAELIPLCGGENVHKCVASKIYGMDKVTMEQVLIYNPQVILTHVSGFYTRIFADSRWQQIRAVRDRRIYLIPKIPMNWFDRPPSFMRLIGARWLAHVLYPDLYKFDQARDTRYFYSLFLHKELSEEELQEIFKP